MFLLRSAFWLTIAYMAIGPHSLDLGAVADDLSTRAVAAGQRAVADAVFEGGCDTIPCNSGKAVVAAALTTFTPSSASRMQDSPREPVPFPRPRPDWMG